MSKHSRGSAISAMRLPPHSIDAECAVLGGLMLDARAWDHVVDRLAEDDFYRADHRLVFRAIAQLSKDGKPFDAVTLGEWFEASGLSDDVGLGYVVELANATPSAANIAAYADIVRDKSILRQLIGVTADIANDAFKPGAREVKAILEDAEQRIFRIADAGSRGSKGFVSVSQSTRQVWKTLYERAQSQGGLTGLSTGYVDLDALTSGLQPSDLVIVAARPSMGKTSFCMNIAEHAALHAGATVAVFSMEMSAAQLSMRLAASVGRISLSSLRTGQLAEEEWPRVTHALTQINDMKLFIDDTPALTPEDMRARARRLKREQGLDLVVVDYLQLMRVTDAGAQDTRANQIAEISRGLKAMAKELDVPVIALSQLNRSLENRPEKRPHMADLRDSGAIEQDADLILFIYRDEVYNKDSSEKGVAELIIGKQRNGPVDTVKLAFLSQYTRFENPGGDGWR